MRISSTSLALLALSPLSMANGALPLSRQFGHALESIQQQQSNTRSLTFKKSLIRALQDQTDTEQEMTQELLDALGPELVAALPCLMALDSNGMGDDDGGGDVDDGGDDDENPPLAFLDGYMDDACDESTGICDFSSEMDEEKIKCDETGGKIILNDILFCKEEMDDGDEEAPDMDMIFNNAPDMDIIFNNVPVCFPQICPDDSNMMELAAMAAKMVVIIFAQMFGDLGDDTEMDMEAIGMLGMKQECASGTKLATSDKKDTETETGGGSSAAVRNIVWSFSVAAAVGIGAFLAV